MHQYYSNFTSGDTVCLTVDALAGFELDERELGMITEVTFTGLGVVYTVSWSDRSIGAHIEQELTLIVGQEAAADKPKKD